jgi:outer membrane protein TolC
LHSPWPKLDLPAVAGPVEYNDRLVRLALQNEPGLKVVRREVQAAETVVEATRQSRYPDVALGIEGRQYSGDGGFREGMFTLNLSLPWLNGGKYKHDVARDRARLQAAQYEAADSEQAVREEIHHLTVAIDAARREALLYRDEIIPRSGQALASARESWIAGRGMSLEVMEARRMLLDAEMTQARAVVTQYSRLAELVLCCGLGDLEALQMINVLPVEKAGARP